MVVGGSDTFSGAPYYAAASALNTGCDIVCMITHESVLTPIRCYSPELIVSAYPSNAESVTKEFFVERLKNFHVVVLGPGLGRSDLSMAIARSVLQACSFLKLPIVIDADGLFCLFELISNGETDLLGHLRCIPSILTPNKMELKRLIKSLQKVNPHVPVPEDEENPILLADYAAKCLHGPCLLCKDVVDLVAMRTPGEKQPFVAPIHPVWFSNDPTSHIIPCLKRCGGQGDAMAGAAALFLVWAKEKKDIFDDRPEAWLLHAAAAASLLIRGAASQAFEEKGRSLGCPDVLNFIGSAFRKLFDEDQQSEEEEEI